MAEFERKVIEWRASLGKSAPDDRTMRSLCNPQIRPIVERMMEYVRPAEEVQMVKRIVAISKVEKAFGAEERNSKDEEKAALERKYKALKVELQEKRDKQLAQRKRIESLKREVEQKHRKASSLQHEISEINKLTATVTAASHQLLKKSKQLCDSNCVAVYRQNVAQEQPSPCGTSSIVSMFTSEQEKAIQNVKKLSIPAPPEQMIDMKCHMELIELRVKQIAMKKQLKENDSKLEGAVEGLVQRTAHALPGSVNQEMVREWAKLQVTRQTTDALRSSLKEVISAHSGSLRCDRDYLRAVLIDDEKKLNTLDERYKSVQKELLQLAKELSHSWQRVEEAAESARRKRSQLEVECKDAQGHISELTDKLRRAAAVELAALHETMTSLLERKPTIQEVLDFGATRNDLFYVLKLLAQKWMARREVPSLPKLFTPTEDPRLEHLVSTISDRAQESGRYKKFSSTCEELESVLSNNDRLVHSLSDLIAIWWQPPFETGVPEEVVVSGKNILQHTAHWDRVAAFLEKKETE